MVWYTFKKFKTVDFKLLYLFGISKDWGVALVKRERKNTPDNEEVNKNPSLWS